MCAISYGYSKELSSDFALVAELQPGRSVTARLFRILLLYRTVRDRYMPFLMVIAKN